jgi:hypothetical protein
VVDKVEELGDYLSRTLVCHNEHGQQVVVYEFAIVGTDSQFLAELLFQLFEGL